MKISNIVKITAVFLTLAAFPALAQEAGEGAAIGKGLAAIGAGLAGLGAAVGVGLLAGRLLEAISRQPELEGKLMGKFWITVGLTDAVPFIALVFAILIILGVF